MNFCATVGDCFAFIDFSSHSVLLTNYAKTGLVVASCNKINGMKDLLLGFYVAVQILNLETSRSRLADTSKNSTEMRAARAARLFFLIYPIRSFFPALPLPKLPIALATSFPGSLFLPSFFLRLQGRKEERKSERGCCLGLDASL